MTLLEEKYRLKYGNRPVDAGALDMPDWDEFVHVLYLPVQMPGQPGLRIPESLVAQGFHEAVSQAVLFARKLGRAEEGEYVYLTARRGFASPDNPLNRPGWHCDGFGTNDLNFIWSDRWGTRLADHAFTGISDDHIESLRQFEEQVNLSRVTEMETGRLWMLDPSVVHNTPEVPAPGGMRSFFKVSISPHRYNLKGNSHNWSFDYEWTMYPRDIARNDPARSQADFYTEEEQ